MAKLRSSRSIYQLASRRGSFFLLFHRKSRERKTRRELEKLIYSISLQYPINVIEQKTSIRHGYIFHNS